MDHRRIYRFGDFTLDATAKVVSRKGEPLHLARRATETLLFLAEHAGRVVTKEEMLTAVWSDRVVDEANLPQNIALIRKALGVGKGEPGHIETFAGRGYRLIGPVERIEEPFGAFAETEAADGTPETNFTVPPGNRPSNSTPNRPDRRKRRLIFAAIAGTIAVVFGAGWLIVSASRRELPEHLSVTPVTRLAGKEIQPAISPDGSKVAFVWEDSAGARLKIGVQVAGEGSPRIFGGDALRCESPAWSPDGRQLAYIRVTARSAAVVIRNLSDGSERVVTQVVANRYGVPNRHLDWSPDGRSLVINDLVPPEHSLSLYVVSVADGQRRRLTTPRDFNLGDVDPRFSPDGKWIAFTRVLHRTSQILCLIPAAGGNVTEFTPDGEQVSGNDWLASSGELVFSSNRTGEFRLWRLQPGAENPAKTIRPTGVYSDFPIEFSIARRSPALVYAVLSYDLNIWRLDLDAPSDAASRWRQIIASTAQDTSPQYSPDGRRICFRSDRSGSEQLWVAGADGSDPVQITSDGMRPSVGRWSPDGRAIIFNETLHGDVMLAEERGKGQWTVRSTGWSGYHPVFSPDGKWVYVGTMSSIVRFPAGGGRAEEVAKTRGLSLGVSEDGASIFFVHDAADTALWALDLPSGTTRQVIDHLVPYCSSCWAVAHDGIYYVSGDPPDWNRQQVRYFDFRTRTSREVAPYPEPVQPIGIGPFSLSPDARYLLTVRVEPTNTDIIRVNDFR